MSRMASRLRHWRCAWPAVCVWWSYVRTRCAHHARMLARPCAFNLPLYRTSLCPPHASLSLSFSLSPSLSRSFAHIISLVRSVAAESLNRTTAGPSSTPSSRTSPSLLPAASRCSSPRATTALENRTIASFSGHRGRLRRPGSLPSEAPRFKARLQRRPRCTPRPPRPSMQPSQDADCRYSGHCSVLFCRLPGSTFSL